MLCISVGTTNLIFWVLRTALHTACTSLLSPPLPPALYNSTYHTKRLASFMHHDGVHAAVEVACYSSAGASSAVPLSRVVWRLTASYIALPLARSSCRALSSPGAAGPCRRLSARHHTGQPVPMLRCFGLRGSQGMRKELETHAGVPHTAQAVRQSRSSSDQMQTTTLREVPAQRQHHEPGAAGGCFRAAPAASTTHQHAIGPYAPLSERCMLATADSICAPVHQREVRALAWFPAPTCV